MAQRFDLDVEAVNAHRVILSRREAVEDAAADRELAALSNLRDALIAGRNELQRHLVKIDQVALAQREAPRPQGRIRNLLRKRDGRDNDDRRLAVGRVEQRVKRRDAQAN